MASTLFSPTPGELALVNQIFAQADPQKLGILTGEVAVKVFGGAKLSPIVLGEIWNLADDDNNGFLTKKGVAVAVRLMGWAQKDEKINRALINKPGPLPTIEGVTPLVKQNTGASSTLPMRRQPTGFPPLTPQDKTKFLRLFATSGPVNGLLSGEKARDIFVKSKLPVDKLSQIWNLADTQDRGALDATDFAIGMYLIQASMSGQISFIPTTLPPGLYEQAGGNVHGQVATHATGTTGSFSPSRTSSALPPGRNVLQPQYTGQALQSDYTGLASAPASRIPAQFAQSPSALGNGVFPTSHANGHGPPWDVSSVEKSNSDRFFDGLDSQKRGFIEGDVAVPFMLQSKLSEEDLAQIWDLADINNDGRLTREGFAVAMHLIQGKLAGKPIPATLPPSLVPPSMRPAPASEPLRDLLWDDTPPPSATTAPSSALVTQPTNVAKSQPMSFLPAPSDPFSATSSTFGNAVHNDLLGDDDDIGTSSPPLHDRSAEIGNTQNQLSSTNRSLQTAKTDRAAMEQNLANQAAELSTLQTQLSSAKAAYETETKLLQTLRDRYSNQTTEMQKTRQELIRAESDLSAIRVEKAEVEGSFLRDKEEARDLHRKMVEVGQEVESLKGAVEKAKKEAKQQKGLLAIARKQLSTKDIEKAKAEKLLEEANIEVQAASHAREQAEQELANLASTPSPTVLDPSLSRIDSVSFAAAHELPITPDPASPTLSTISPSILGRSNNPFDRIKMSPDTPRSQSPFLPFVHPAVPTPTVVGDGQAAPPALAAEEDPFGFSQAFEEPEPATPKEAGTTAEAVEPESATPRITTSQAKPPASDTTNPGSPTTVSDNEQFSTPPMSAQGLYPDILGASSTATSPTIEDAVNHFPALSEVSPAGQSNAEAPKETHEVTDLESSLKEVEVEESDSENEEDEVPLAQLKRKSVEGKASPAPKPTTSQTGSAFDDVFGDSEDLAAPKPQSSFPPPPKAASPSPAKDAFGAVIGSAASPFERMASPALNVSIPTTDSTAAGVNAFDEAMGKISNSAPSSAVPQLSFDSAFDDNFDFASVSEKFPPAPSAPNGGPSTTSSGFTSSGFTASEGFDSIFTAPTSNGAASAVKPEAPIPSFDDTFAASSNGVPPSLQPGSSAPAPSQQTPSFDDIFSGLETSQQPALDTSFSSHNTKPATPPRGASTDSQTLEAASPITNQSPKATPRSTSIGTTSRQRSPPPRGSSPKPRVSSSSSKESAQDKPPAQRHSKLSIRLPFGKKKRQETLPPPPQPHHTLSPTAEEPPPSGTPAADDDVDAVKQLLGMGFSRTQAVEALERYSYDLPKALNSLLGQ